MVQDQETRSRMEAFNSELSFELRSRFRSLALSLNGDGGPTARQLTACAIESAVEIQRHSPDFIEEYLFMQLMEPLRKHPEYGKSMMSFYEASCNGNGKV